MKVLNVKLLLNLILMAMFASKTWAATGSEVDVLLERVGGMTHLEFQGQKEWVYDLKKEGSLLKLSVPRLSPKAIDKLESFSSLLIEKIEVDSKTPNKTLLSLKLNDEKIESFDYLTQQPSNLVIDIYVADDSLLNKIKQNNIAKLEKVNKKSKKVAKKTKKMEKQSNVNQLLLSFLLLKKRRNHKR